MEIHYSVNEEDACSTQPGGSETVGVDKGYTEAYTDSDGKRHGQGLGDLLAAESDARKVKGQRRNRMRDLEPPGCRQCAPPQPRQPEVGPPPKATQRPGRVPGFVHRRLPDGSHAVGQGHAPRHPTV